MLLYQKTDIADISSTAQVHVDWTSDHEQILVEWADKAMCYRWLHSKAHQSFAKANAWFTIPVIIMSTTTGTANLHKRDYQKNTEVTLVWVLEQ